MYTECILGDFLQLVCACKSRWHHNTVDISLPWLSSCRGLLQHCSITASRCLLSVPVTSACTKVKVKQTLWGRRADDAMRTFSSAAKMPWHEDGYGKESQHGSIHKCSDLSFRSYRVVVLHCVARKFAMHAFISFIFTS